MVSLSDKELVPVSRSIGSRGAFFQGWPMLSREEKAFAPGPVESEKETPRFSKENKVSIGETQDGAALPTVDHEDLFLDPGLPYGSRFLCKGDGVVLERVILDS